MKRCPITYEIIPEAQDYSRKGLNLLARKLTQLRPLDYSAQEQRNEAIARANKMSIQGVQPKLSANLKIKEEYFAVVDQGGHYILKPQHSDYPELPQNEALTMSLAKLCGIDVPIHGLVYSKDKSLTYFIKRFDRVGHRTKLAVEDFAQLSQESRETKYSSSTEQLIKIITQYCSFPVAEKLKFFQRMIFNFLVGNEDMHLKNCSLITLNSVVGLSPAYDLLNTSIAQKYIQEELALPLNGKKSKITKNDLLDYLPRKLLQLNDEIIHQVVTHFANVIPQLRELIKISFLSEEMQEAYWRLLVERAKRLDLVNKT